MVESPHVDSFDEIDTAILQILSENPRTSYTEIQDRIEERGHEMSTEGIRYRVSKIFERTTPFFLLDPKEIDWEILRVAIKTSDDSGAKSEVFDLLSSLPFWHVAKGLGSFDVFAVGTAPTISEVDELVTKIKESDLVQNIDYMIVTERNRDMNSYLSLDYISE